MKQAHVPTGYGQLNWIESYNNIIRWHNMRKPTVYIGLITCAIWKNQSLPAPGPKEQ